ncbi:hypothetical protein OUZ56_007520 [Daphnia magna]|uniref:Uncharacterized protein n=1 Tax=Daphnia magna TaxID=35525 RepID=A0ABR0AAM6_9CRUS|nr:hypothetical protein OUZ56_007520 [Daphnia magna]
MISFSKGSPRRRSHGKRALDPTSDTKCRRMAGKLKIKSLFGWITRKFSVFHTLTAQIRNKTEMLEDDALLPALLYVSRPTAGLSFPNASSIVRHLAVGIGTIPYRHNSG